uniref:Uncharacterized protein n=1 Tax=Sphaerodactylus townsendi TaxID=933632 RepID=A0ACB8FTE3_9SAUR
MERSSFTQKQENKQGFLCFMIFLSDNNRNDSKSPFFFTLLIIIIHNHRQVLASDIEVLAQVDGRLETGKCGLPSPKGSSALQFSAVNQFMASTKEHWEPSRIKRICYQGPTNTTFSYASVAPSNASWIPQGTRGKLRPPTSSKTSPGNLGDDGEQRALGDGFRPHFFNCLMERAADVGSEILRPDLQNGPVLRILWE